jgi:hypothetical protein
MHQKSNESTERQYAKARFEFDVVRTYISDLMLQAVFLQGVVIGFLRHPAVPANTLDPWVS